VAKYFGARGYAVVIAGRDPDRGCHLEAAIREAGGRALFVPTDVRNEQDVRYLIEQTIQQWGRLDVLCNNAGIEVYRRADEYTLEEWNAIIDTNLRGTFLCSKYAFPHLRQQQGSIVIISSVQATACERNISVYAASKAGQLALMRGMALDFAPERVRVNAISPGATRTGMLAETLAKASNPDAVLRALESSIPLGRVGEAEDVASAVYYLASPEASYITGATLTVDGGLLVKLAT
jgi:NAD(P)-dependent dehydrogenase (short-subunit alcohol dehydrogenase family)